MSSETTAKRWRYLISSAKWLWLTISFMLVLGAGFLMYGGITLKGDMLALFPQSQQQPTVQAAIEQMSASFLKRVTLIATFPDRQLDIKTARSVANELQSRLDESPVPASTQALPTQRDRWQHHRYSLLTAEVKDILQTRPQQLLDRARQSLYGLNAVTQPIDLVADPLNLHANYLQRWLPRGLEPLTTNVLLGHNEAGQHLLITFAISASAFDSQAANQLLDLVARMGQTATRFEGQVHASGLPIFAAHGTRSAQREISIFGSISLLGVLLLLTLTFRNLRPLTGTLLCLGLGVSAAFVTTHLVFGEVHLITLVFGASLIGISVDYAFHFLCDAYNTPDWTPEDGLRSVLPGTCTAMVTSLLAFGSFVLTPFPGLQQIAVFSATGLLIAWLTAVVVLPWLNWQPTPGQVPLTLKLSNQWLRHWPLISPPQRWVLIAGASIVLGLGLFNLTPNDHVALLQTTPTEVAREDARVRAFLPNSRTSQFILVEAPDEATLLARERRATEQLQALGINHYALSDLYPDRNLQIENQRLLAAQLFTPPNPIQPGLMESWYQSLGAAELYQQAFEVFSTAPTPVSLDKWVTNASPDLQVLWLGCRAQGCQSVIALESFNDAATLADLCASMEGITWVDEVSSISNLLAEYRVLATQLLLLVYLMVMLAFMVRLGWRKGLRVTLVPGISCATALAVFGLSGNPFNLFNLLGLMVVIGISIDYAVFYALHGRRRQSTALAIGLSAVTTLLAFGMLSMSTTTVVHSFGLTLLVGILTAFLIAPIAADIPDAQKQQGETS